MSRGTVGLLYTSHKDQERCSEFFRSEVCVDPNVIARGMHLTVYSSNLSLTELQGVDEKTSIVILTDKTRFMVMAPGGEKSRPDINPLCHKIGFRIQKSSPAAVAVAELRERMVAVEQEFLACAHETASKVKISAGANFQPHITVLFPGHGVSDISTMATKFRSEIESISFDRFKTKVRGAG